MHCSTNCLINFWRENALPRSKKQQQQEQNRSFLVNTHTHENMLDLAIALVICGTVALGITPWNKNSQQLKQIGNKNPLSHIQHVKNERQRLNSQDEHHPLSITFGGSNDRTPPLMLTHAPPSTTTTILNNQQQLMLVPNPQQLSVALRSAPRSTTQRNTNFLFKIIGDSYFAKWLLQFVSTVVQVRRERRSNTWMSSSSPGHMRALEGSNARPLSIKL